MRIELSNGIKRLEQAASRWLHRGASAEPTDAAPRDAAVLGTGTDEARLPLSLADRISLGPDKKQKAQAFYDVGRELARRVTGSADGFEYKSTGLTNVDNAFSLWSLQARHGDKATTIKSVPVTLMAVAAGAVSNVPIEGAKVEEGRLVSVQAGGHNFNPLLNAASAVAAGLALTLVPPLAAVALAGPLLTAAPLLIQRLGDTNAPVHEMTHAMQFLLEGDLMRRGLVDESDLVAMQNDAGPTGYLWGGDTEKAARSAETAGDLSPMFDVLRKRVADRLEERHSAAAGPLVEEACRVLDAHQAWMTQELAGRLG